VIFFSELKSDVTTAARGGNGTRKERNTFSAVYFHGDMKKRVRSGKVDEEMK
jgi:hypothetical protein